MRKLYFDKKDAILLHALIVFGSALSALLLCIWGNQPQAFSDVIMGLVSTYAENKCEEQVFWLVCGLGIGVILLFSLWRYRRHPAAEPGEPSRLENTSVWEWAAPFFVMLLFAFLSSALLYKQINPFCLVFSLLGVCVLLTREREKFREKMSLALLTWLDLIALFEILSVAGKKWSFASSLCLILAVWFGMLLILFCCYDDKLIAFTQLPLPLLLTVFLKDRYAYQGKTVLLEQPRLFRACIVFLAAILLCQNVRNAVRKKEAGRAVPGGITLSSCIAVALFFSGYCANRGGITQMIVTASKPASEEVIAFQQLMLGQGLMADYYPVSGLYAVPMGALLELLGGTYEKLFMATTLFRLAFLAVLVLLLSQYLNRFQLLFLSAFIIFPSYNRLYLVLLAYLALHMEKLVHRPGLWLKVWIWVCFLTGLYYPMYGVAVLVGTVPLGMRQVKEFYRNDMKGWDRRQRFRAAASWTVILLPIVLCIPLLWEYAGHLLTYSRDVGQATTGIPPLFGKEISSQFLPYIDRVSLKQFAFYMTYFAIPLALVWLASLVLIKAVALRGQFGIIGRSQAVCLLAILLFCCAGEIRRITGSSNFSSLHGGILYAGIFLTLLVLLQYVHFNASGLLCLAVAAVIAATCGMTQTGKVDRYCQTAFSVGKDYVQIKEKDYERLGSQGFIDAGFQKELKDLQGKAARLQEVRPDIPFLGLRGNSSTYLYILDLPACGQISLDEITTYDTWMQLKTEILEQRPAIGTGFDKTAPYYLYYWLLTTAEYRYSAEFDMFLPAELYQELGLHDHTDYCDITFAQRKSRYQMAGNFGNSIEQLSGALIKSEVNADFSGVRHTRSQTIIRCKLEKPVDGAEYDFVYVDMQRTGEPEDTQTLREFVGVEKEEDINVSLEWEDGGEQYSYECAFRDGRLLIPAGLVNHWLLNRHSEFVLRVDAPDVEVNEVFLAGLARR